MSFFISDAMAQDAASSGGPDMTFLIMIGVFFAIMYFMIIRPQSKKAKEHKQMLEGLGKNNEVVTTGGLLGKVVSMGENFVEIRVSDSTTVKVQKHAISTVMPKGTMKSL